MRHEGVEGLLHLRGPPHEELAHLVRESLEEVVIELDALRERAAGQLIIFHDGLEARDARGDVLELVDLRGSID